MAFTPSDNLCAEGVCRSCSDFTLKSFLEKAISHSQLSGGAFAPSYGAGLPRTLSEGNPRSRVQAALPSAGRSMGGRLLDHRS